MRMTKRLIASTAVLLLSAGVALAATSPSGTFKGTTHTKDAKGHPDTFQIQAKFAKGKLTGLTGQGNWIPFNAKKTTSTYCGAANTYDDTGMKITQKAAPKGFAWEFVITPKKATGYGWFTVTLKGNWDSATKASTAIRFYEHNLPDKGHCDSGFVALTLKKS